MRKANDKAAEYMLLVADLRKELLETRQVESCRRDSGKGSRRARRSVNERRLETCQAER